MPEILLCCVHCDETVSGDIWRSNPLHAHLLTHDIDVDETPRRYCVYCGCDCADTLTMEHHSLCPVVTRLEPVLPNWLGMRGPDDKYAHGMLCAECSEPFQVGDLAVLRPISDEDFSDFFEHVCVGCGVLTVTEELS